MNDQTIEVRHFIGGEWSGAVGDKRRTNPSDITELIAVLPAPDPEVLNQAVAAARAAQPGWAKATPEVRADCLHEAGEIILARAQELGRLLSREEGKTLAKGVGEVTRAGRILRYFAGEAIRRHGLSLDSVRAGVDVQTLREPLGVVGLITPWNFPIAIPAWKAAPALAFGNTVVMKPASHTAAIAAAFAGILSEAGLPPGVFNLVIGPGSLGDALVRHPDVDAISFTGSQRVGGSVAMGAPARQARFQLEMGDKNPLVILDDADLVRAVDYEAALEVANQGEFGLSAGIVTQSLKHARHFQRSVRAGMVMVNLPTAGVDYHVPFGGMGKSSFGSHEQGFAAIEFYTQLRTVYAAA